MTTALDRADRVISRTVWKVVVTNKASFPSTKPATFIGRPMGNWLLTVKKLNKKTIVVVVVAVAVVVVLVVVVMVLSFLFCFYFVATSIW